MVLHITLREDFCGHSGYGSDALMDEVMVPAGLADGVKALTGSLAH